MTDPDYAVRGLYNTIAQQQYPYWTLYVQVMTYQQARTWEFDPFDPSKVMYCKTI